MKGGSPRQEGGIPGRTRTCDPRWGRATPVTVGRGPLRNDPRFCKPVVSPHRASQGARRTHHPKFHPKSPSQSPAEGHLLRLVRALAGIQNPPVATPSGFESRLRHQSCRWLEAALRGTGGTRTRRRPPAVWPSGPPMGLRCASTWRLRAGSRATTFATWSRGVASGCSAPATASQLTTPGVTAWRRCRRCCLRRRSPPWYKASSRHWGIPCRALGCRGSSPRESVSRRPFSSSSPVD